MKNGNGNLRSLAQTLSSKHRRNLEPNKNVTFTNENPAFKLRPGRHRCDCQARIHSLIRNCLSCGRIVCAQEGSGPCFCCGELVCTREEREILNRNSKKSLELFNRLMGGTVHSQDQGTSSRTSLAKLGDALSKAEEFRDRLLQADAEREKQTRVNDLEADYYSMESDVYLTQEEREAIKARKEELKEMREKRKRTMLINLDLQNMQATEVQQKDTITGHDPVIQTILKKSQQRHSGGRKASEGHWVPSSFVPMYDESIGRKHTNTDSYDVNFAEDVMNFTNDEIMYAEVERKGLAIAFDQPFASLLSCGCRRHIPWKKEIILRGPLFIASTSKIVMKNEIEREEMKCRELILQYEKEGINHQSKEIPLQYPSASFVGRALLIDCLPISEYISEYPNGECVDSAGPYVLIFDVFEPLLVPIPHVSPTNDDVYKVDKHLRTAVKHILDPYCFL